uniref:probable 26S protease regulatory subunit 10B isoform X1 n=1 Tax=Fragaria vesca subsp. vesca TaxID=101020 RepID=UPI0005CA10E8|nr:PREDICTED: probable 26S protease regulatory subunit 10B isoform X1 [Fragaria vesca subsp. vesca]
MTIFRRIILRTARTRWSVPQSLNPPPRACSRDVRLLCHRCFEQPYHSDASEIQVPKFVPGRGGPGGRYLMYPAVLAGLIGLGGLEVAYADAEEAASKQGFPADAPVSNNVEDIAKKQRQDIEDRLKSKGMRRGTYPNFTVSVKGQKVTVKFQIPPSCEASQVIANIASNLGLKVEENGGGSDISLRAWDSGVAWQLMLMHPEKKKKTEGDQGEVKDVNEHERDLHILVFRSVISSTEKTEIEFMKQGSLSLEELDALISALQLAGAQKSFIHQKNDTSTTKRRAREGSAETSAIEKLITSLESMGVRVYGVDESNVSSASKDISWDNLAGYDLQKRQIEDTILLALLSPETYDDIARGTRRKYESNRPRAVLFEGPPGTGKTSSARVIANQAGVPMLYVPLEVILSKYYGESERLLGKVFSLANELPNGAIIFLDEVDSFATSRDSDLHEATRRVLSVLLRQIDGFEQDKKVVVIAATNRKQDLDPALISRFDSIILFGLPDHQNRKEIAAQYAKHLTQPELDELATVTEEMSGRDIRDVCQQAERSWASKLIRGLVPKDGDQIRLPPLPEYIASAMNRHKGLLRSPRQQTQNSKSDIKKARVVLD